MKILEIRGLTYSYPGDRAGLLAVRDVSLEICEGEVIAVLGPSGCGKTTLLNVIAGFLPSEPGTVLLDGRPVQGPGRDRGVVFQRGALFEWMTVRANIEFSLRLRGVPVAERRRASDQLIEVIGLAGHGDKFPYELSGGMQQRVGVARVLAASPRILLMDEPFAAVDIQTRESLQEELLRLQAAQRTTILFITHSIDEAIFVAHRVVVMTGSPGQIQAEFPVALPAPRWNFENRVHADFVALRERIYKLLRKPEPTTPPEPARRFVTTSAGSVARP